MARRVSLSSIDEEDIPLARLINMQRVKMVECCALASIDEDNLPMRLTLPLGLIWTHSIWQLHSVYSCPNVIDQWESPLENSITLFQNELEQLKNLETRVSQAAQELSQFLNVLDTKRLFDFV